MHCYRLYFFNDKHISDCAVVVAESDDAAVAKATALFEPRARDFSGFEIWDRARVVARQSEMELA